jgi:hypothetical protein
LSGRISFLIIVGALVVTSLPAAQAVTTCDAANPYDTTADDVALQRCVDQFDQVLLDAPGRQGYVGYLITNAVDVQRNGILITSRGSPRKATLLAAPTLTEPVIRIRANQFELSFVHIDGNRDERDGRDKPCSEFRNYRNAELSGVGFHVRYVESSRAVCGSGMTVGASNRFEIVNSWFYDNGRQPEDAGGIGGLWADGLTVFNCTGATIRDNVFWDNTDVDLGVNGGPGCSVYRNMIEHFNRYAFAGIVAGDPTRSGGAFTENRVGSALNMLGLGFVVGCHPWAQCGGGYASDLRIAGNHVSGAVVNLVVDGVNGGSVENNTMMGAQGTRAPNCLQAADYIVAHVINVRLQSGFVVRVADAGTPCP